MWRCPAAAASVFIIEGLGQQSYGSLNWGDGLIIDPSIISQFGLSDPNPFFKELLTKPYRRQVVVGVHIYPPAISKVGCCLCACGGSCLLDPSAACVLICMSYSAPLQRAQLLIRHSSASLFLL